MPMSFASWDMHYIANQELPRCLAFGANEACSHRNRQDLPALVRVPKSACARSEADVVSHAVIGGEDGIHVHRTCEGFGGLLGGSVGLVGGAN